MFAVALFSIGSQVATSDAPALESMVLELVNNPRNALSGTRVVSIEGLPKLCELERRQDKAVTRCSEDAWGSIIENVGDRDGDGRDELLVGVVGEFIDDVVERLSDAHTGRVVITARSSLASVQDQMINAVTALRDPRTGIVRGYAVGSDRETGLFCNGYGRVRVFPSAGEWRDPPKPEGGPWAGDDFGAAITDAGDFDGDELPDVAVAYSMLGTVTVFSTACGAPLVTTKLRVACSTYESPSLAGGRDLDGDGEPDLCIASPCVGDCGEVEQRSGRELKLRRRLVAPTTGGLFGRALALVPDLDGDGAAELAIGAPWIGEADRGAAWIVSGKTGRVLFAWIGKRDDGALGRCVRADHDLDGDEVRDIIVSAPGGTTQAVRGAVYVFSGASGRALLVIEGEPTPSSKRWGGEMRSSHDSPVTDAFGWALATGDFDGDHVPDLAIGSPQRSGRDCVGKVYLISGVTLRDHMTARAEQAR